MKRTLLSGYIKSVAKLCNIQIDGRFLWNALEIEYNTTLEASLYFFSPQIFLFGVQAAFLENWKLYFLGMANSVAYSPLAEDIIVLRWQEGINPALPGQIQEDYWDAYASKHKPQITYHLSKNGWSCKINHSQDYLSLNQHT